MYRDVRGSRTFSGDERKLLSKNPGEANTSVIPPYADSFLFVLCRMGLSSPCQAVPMGF